MKYLLIIFLTTGLMTTLQSQDPTMKQAQKEAEKEAKKKLSDLQKMFSKNSVGFSEDDLLPDIDKGKSFDAASADKNLKNAALIAEFSNLNIFLEEAKKREQLEVDESFLVEGHCLIENPQDGADISSLETTTIPEEEKLETCQENGTYQIAFLQKLVVQVTPDVKQDTKHCLGHTKKTTYDTVKKAKHHVTTKKEAFKNNSEILSYEVHRDEKKVTSSWKHKDNINTCNHFNVESKIFQEGTEKDLWETDRSKALAIIESNHFCKLLYTQAVQGPETRVINGKAVTRDLWAHQLYFSCEPDPESKCAKLRNQGGVLMSKNCLKENEFGECDLWEKTYDLGKKGASQLTKATFKNETLWGIHGDFDTTYDKNLDFGSTLATLSVFSDLEHNLEEQNTDFHKQVQIFKGEKFTCEKSFIEGKVFDCCKKMDGLAVNIHLAHCKAEEKCLGEKRHEGKCRFIGSHKTKLGSITEHVYCCFPSKLARVIHEQGRKQLGIKWGKADKPKCRGLSLEELQKIDFGKIDLSEVIDDIKVDKQAYQNKLKGSVESLQTKVKAQIEEKRLELSEENKAHAKVAQSARQFEDLSIVDILWWHNVT